MKNKIKIRIPLSTANLGCGFDSFGLALSRYNTYVFEKSEKFELFGFKEEYNNDDNMCIKAYIFAFNYYKKDIINASITLDQNIFNCGGLGSSANVIIAGVTAAYYFMFGRIDKDEIFKLSALIEGHPDNVAAEVYGSFTSCVNAGDLKVFKYEVSDDLIFTLLIPSFSLNTVEMRKCVKKEVKLEDAIFNLSRAANLAYALKKGSVDDLAYLMEDRIHQRYRIDKINGACDVEKYAKEKKYAFAISGSGASLLLVSKEKVDKKFPFFENYELKVDSEGLKIYEED